MRAATLITELQRHDFLILKFSVVTLMSGHTIYHVKTENGSQKAIQMHNLVKQQEKRYLRLTCANESQIRDR